MTHFAEVKSGANRRFTFDVDNVDLSIVNAVRRVILAEVPNVAFAFDPYEDVNNDIRFTNNTSSLHNEFMGHRISLIPINLTLKEIKEWDPANFGFRINMKNEGTEMLLVTSKQIEVIDGMGEQVSSEVRNRWFPEDPITNDHVLITKLKANPFNPKEGECFECDMRARKGTAKQHSRWSHVSLCSFINKIDEPAAQEAYKQMMKQIDPSLTDEEKNRIINRFNCIDRLRIFSKNKYGEPSRFTFSIETVNSMVLAHELVTTAFEILIDKIKQVASPEKSEIHCLNPAEHMFMIKIRDEGHTIGNMLQSLIFNMYMRDEKLIQYVGYYQPHPLENDVVIKLRHDQLDTESQIRDFLAESCRIIEQQLVDLKLEWVQANGTVLAAPAKPPKKTGRKKII